MDFYKIVTTENRKGKLETYADFNTNDVKDILFRGRAFHAVWDEEAKLWNKKDTRVVQIVDRDIWKAVNELKEKGVTASPRLMSSFKSQSWKDFLTYTKSMSDNLPNVQLDSKIIFANQETKRSDYASHKLSYSLVEGPCPAWDELIGTLYSRKEREKIEWAIGSIVTGDSRKIQKFIVLYGSPGSGKGTIIDIIQRLFDGYCTTFNAKALASNNNAFATEMFRGNPLVALQTDGDLSRIEDNTILNTIVSHEPITINEKFKSSYTSRCNAFLFMASNKPVKITDGKSGLIRRLIDVTPAGDGLKPPISPDRYSDLMSQIDFELGAIAWHCKTVYEKLGRNYYSSYRPIGMQYKTDIFFNYVDYWFDKFAEQDSTTAYAAYAMWKEYCDKFSIDPKVYPIMKFREELKNYFENFKDVARTPDGKQIRSYYSSFLKGRFDRSGNEGTQPTNKKILLELEETSSLLDKFLAECKAQYTKENDIPASQWNQVRTRLKDLDTHKLHYVEMPENHIVIDFDISDSTGKKNKEMNLAAAAKWPATYAEFSKGGSGVHLHYIYDGDVHELSRLYEPGIEIKRCADNKNKTPLYLRRRLSYCNALPIAHISGGLPLKEKKVINWDGVISERGIRKTIAAALKKEHHGATKPEVCFIKKVLDDAYESGVTYDISDMRQAVVDFAQNSTNHSQECLLMCVDMKWRSENASKPVESKSEDALIFFDCEVAPNVFLVNWMTDNDDIVHRMWNPSPVEMEEFFNNKLIGFNCRRYDNHMLYARYLGYSTEELAKLSDRIINRKSDNAMFSEAYNISYTDIYDFASKKQSLKKWEIEMGIHHQELGLPWDQPIPEDKMELMAEYCDNDVRATKALFHYLSADWTARKILAALSGLTVNDTTNQHTTAIIFQGNRNPQSQFNYRNMGDVSAIRNRYDKHGIDPEYTCFNENWRPIFPGYSFEHEIRIDENTGKKINRFVSRYRGEEVGEGGYVYAEPGVWRNVALLDIASMHPSSIVAEKLFGDSYTERFRQILQARILIKHGNFEGARHILDGKLKPYLEDEGTAKELAGALKIAINSVYGLTSAKFKNPFRDDRNFDNIVAKRGALFMVNLKHEVQKRGFTVAHIKTDSIKIPNATPDIIQFVMEYGKLYGYNFEHEATYDRMCLVNDAVYIARYSDGEENGKHKGEWTATGAQFQQPYVFKTLFSKEPLIFDDFCETKSVTSGGIHIDYEDGNPPRFVGRVGQFTPVTKGGGKLVRDKDEKFISVTGAKGYLWCESEEIRGTDMEKFVDRSYYDRMVDEAVKDISEFEDFETFIA